MQNGLGSGLGPVAVLGITGVNLQVLLLCLFSI